VRAKDKLWILVYKTGFLFTKRESRNAIHPLGMQFTPFSILFEKYLTKNIKKVLTSVKIGCILHLTIIVKKILIKLKCAKNKLKQKTQICFKNKNKPKQKSQFCFKKQQLYIKKNEEKKGQVFNYAKRKNEGEHTQNR